MLQDLEASQAKGTTVSADLSRPIKAQQTNSDIYLLLVDCGWACLVLSYFNNSLFHLRGTRP